MNNKNIVSNMTLEQYIKKYHNRRDRLLKYTKKELEEFDNKYPSKTKYRLLKDRKWLLIEDTYYEIPKPIRLTWFRNLHGSIQIGVSVLLCGAVVTSIALPIYFSYRPIEELVSVDSDTKEVCDIISNKINDNGDRELVLQAKGDRVVYKKIEVKIGNDVLKEKEEYKYELVTSNDDSKKYNLTIFKAALEAHQGKIVIKPILEPRLKIVEGNLDLILGEGTLQLHVIDMDTKKDLTDEVFFYCYAQPSETFGIECDQDGIVTTERVGGGHIMAIKSGYITDKIDASVKADTSKGNWKLTLNKNIPEAGDVIGGGTYPYYTSVVASANANPNYSFVEWQDESGTKLTDKFYYDVRVTKNITLNAVFEHNLELFKRIYDEQFKVFDESTQCPYSSCTYTDSLGSQEEIALNYQSLADPKICTITPRQGMDPITVAGGEYTYDAFVDKLEALKSQTGYTFTCTVTDTTKKILSLIVNKPDGTIYGSYVFNSYGYLLQYGKTEGQTYKSYSITYKLKQ